VRSSTLARIAGRGCHGRFGDDAADPQVPANIRVVEVTRLDAPFGVQVRGLDGSGPLTDEVSARLRSLLAEHLLLVVRAPGLDAEAQVALLSHFGQVLDERGDGGRHVFVSNTRPDGVLGSERRLLFHSDCTFATPPISVLSLYALEVPDQPSPTVFADASRAFQRLAPATRDRLRGERAVFVSGFAGGYERYSEESAPAGSPRAVHPVVFDDAVSGRPVLMVDELLMDRIVGWERADSEALRDEAHGVLYGEDNLYAHHWQVGDLVVWDNLALQHGRPERADDGARTLRRVAVVPTGTGRYEPFTARSLASEARERAGGF